jgi:hypothetical protein
MEAPVSGRDWRAHGHTPGVLQLALAPILSDGEEGRGWHPNYEHQQPEEAALREHVSDNTNRVPGYVRTLFSHTHKSACMHAHTQQRSHTRVDMHSDGGHTKHPRSTWGREGKGARGPGCHYAGTCTATKRTSPPRYYTPRHNSVHRTAQQYCTSHHATAYHATPHHAIPFHATSHRTTPRTIISATWDRVYACSVRSSLKNFLRGPPSMEMPRGYTLNAARAKKGEAIRMGTRQGGGENMRTGPSPPPPPPTNEGGSAFTIRTRASTSHPHPPSGE